MCLNSDQVYGGPVLDTVIDLLAVIRLVRLVIKDEGSPVVAARKVLIEDWTTADWQAELAECPWCVSFWIGLGVALMRLCIPKLWNPIARALAASLLAGAVIDR